MIKYTALLVAISCIAGASTQTLRGIRDFRTGGIRTLKETAQSIFQATPRNNTKADHALRVIVRYKTPRGKAMALELASEVFYQFDERSAVVVNVDEDGLESLMASTQDILAVDGDSPMQQHGLFEQEDQPNSRRHLTQTTPYGIPMVQADQVSVPSNVAERVSVCLVDTGVLYTHPDLPQSLMTGADRYSTSFHTELYWKLGVDGHGTCLAGILSANMTNNIGIRGVGNIPLYITRGMNNQGECMESDILAALAQCQASGAKVISLSFGGSGISTTFQEALNYLYDDLGVLIFASAGNNGQEAPMYPASYDRVVSVGGVNQTGQHWFASNTGPWIELVAPAAGVWCTGISGTGGPTYSLYSGTSMASPYAAGVAAMVWSYFPSCSNTQIRFAMDYTAKDIGPPGCDTITGNGIVQAKALYDFLSTHPCYEASWGKTISANGCSIV